MPIKPENRALYPTDWPEIRERILVRAGNCCERCGVKNYRLGGRMHDGQFSPALPLGEKALQLEWPTPGTYAYCEGAPIPLRIVMIVLTIAHIHDPDPSNCADDNLQALCQRCHNLLDAPMRRQHAAETRRAGKAVADLFQ